MNRSLLRTEVMPFLGMFGLLLLGAVIGDALLHLFDQVWIGRYLGIPGTLLILLSFTYSLRKRGKIKFGKPKTLLTLHQSLTWAGALMILVHAGIHLYAILPWLALFAMLINLISGMTGQYLLGRSRSFLAEKRQTYAAQSQSEQDIDSRMHWDATTYDLMRKWRTVHLPLTLVFTALSLAHILSIFLFWQWR